MIVCTACGNQGEDDDSFCRSCGAYLEWHGEHVSQPEPEPEPEPATPPQLQPAPLPTPLPRTLVERMREAVQPGSAHGRGRTAGPTGAAGPGAAPAEAPTPASLAAAPEQAAPVVPPPPRPPPSAVRPGLVKAPPPRKVAAAAEPEVPPGGPVCRECRAINAPGRTFCRRCGASLAEVVVFAPPVLPWWRRWWNQIVAQFFRRSPKFRAGERPSVRRRRSTSGLRRNVTRALMLGLLVMVLLPPVRERIWGVVTSTSGKAKDAVTQSYSPVRPIEVTATSSAPDHGPELASDRHSNTYWAESAPGDGEAQGLSFVFDEPVDLAQVIITAGASGSDDAYLSQPRPRLLHVVFDSGSTDEIVLQDVPAPQTFKLKAKQVAKVEFAITLVHKSKASEDCAISEIEFFTRS